MTELKRRSQRQRPLLVMIIVGVSLALTTVASRAVVMNELHNAVVTVPDTGEKARREGFREALEQVLIRLTGSRKVLARLEKEAPDGDKLLQRGAGLVDAYSYRRPDEQLELHVSVSPSALGRELAEREIAVWGATRPGVLVWFLVDNRGERDLINRDASLPPFLRGPMQPLDAPGLGEPGPWKGPLMKSARRRAVPLFLPFYDERDRQRLNLSEIWGLFDEPIERASARYAPDRIAVVRVSRLGNGWSARWALQRPDGEAIVDGTVRETSREAITDSLIDTWARHFSRVFSVSYSEADEVSELETVAAGVDSLADYAAIRGALMSMEPIRSVEPVAVKRDQLRLRVLFSGDLTLVRDYMSLDRRLRLMAAPADGSIGTEAGTPRLAGSPQADRARLYYRWRAEDEEETMESVEDADATRIVPIEESPVPRDGLDGMPSL